MDSALSYKEERQGELTCPLGHRLIFALLNAPYPPLGLCADSHVMIDVDAPLSAGSHVVVEHGGGLHLSEARSAEGALAFHLAGQNWPVRRASWGQSAPVVVGSLVAAGMAL